MKDFSELSATAVRVLDAAEGLIQQHGYNGFSYDDVARLVEIKKPSIHHHFAKKEELVAILVQRYTHRFNQELLFIDQLHVSEFSSAADKLSAYAALFEKTYSQGRSLCVCGMLGAEAQSLPESVTEEVKSFFELNLNWLTQVMLDGQKTGLIVSRTEVTAEALANQFLCNLEGAMMVGRGVRALRGPQSVSQTLISLLTGK